MKLFFILFVLYRTLTFPQNVKERCDDIITILNNDRENIYMIDLASVCYLYRDNKYTTLFTSFEKYHNIFHLGSWETKTPENLKHNAGNNMESPFSACINSQKHIIISSPYNIYLFEKFINEHYDDKATAVPVLENKLQGLYLYRIITGVKDAT